MSNAPAPLAHGTHVTAGTKTVHAIGGAYHEAMGGGYYPQCAASIQGKDVKATTAPITCKSCAKRNA